MKRINTLIRTLFFLFSFFGSLAAANAQCVVLINNPGGGQSVACSGNDLFGVGYVGTGFGDDVTVEAGASIGLGFDSEDGTIDTEEGDDLITINGAVSNVYGDDVIDADPGNDIIEINAGGFIDAQFGDDGVDGGADNDEITLNGGTIIAADDGIDGGDGNDEVTINGGQITAGDNGIEGGDGNDTVMMNGGTINARDGINTDTGNDIISVSGKAVVIAEQDGLDGDEGDDRITVGDARITGGVIAGDHAIEGNEGNDTVILGAGAVIEGIIDGGPPEDAGFDTLIFDMALSGEQNKLICEGIPDGSVTIGENTYTWTNFDSIQPCGESLPALSNISYNGFVNQVIRPAFILLATAELVITAETLGLPDPQVSLKRIADSSTVAFNDNCDVADIALLIGRPLITPAQDACIVETLPPDAYFIEVTGSDPAATGDVLAGVTQPVGSTPALGNISYNGFVSASGIKPAFSVASAAQFVITAENFGLPDPQVSLKRISDSSTVAFDDNCTDPNIVNLLGRPLTTALDACIVVNNLAPGTYFIEVSDVGGGSGNALVGVTQIF